ncbi:MAG: nuclear transport factor 2 family protein [Thermoanaerobaculia bacterium]|nr:nuclear transport factor 2 family protein [Thermoanaerobaculia bacterium]
MKMLTALLTFSIFTILPAMAEPASREIVSQLQAAYDQNTKAMDDGDIDAFMELFAESYVGDVSADERLDREQVREIALAEMNQPRRARSTYSVEKVDLVEVDADGGTRTEIVATVLQTTVDETVDRQGKKVRKTLKVHYRDTFAKNGTNWQILLRESQ